LHPFHGFFIFQKKFCIAPLLSSLFFDNGNVVYS